MRKLDIHLERAKYGYIEKLPKEVKYFEGSMYEAILKSAERYPNRTALEYFKMEISYKEIGQMFGKSEVWGRVTFLRSKDMVLQRMDESKEQTERKE